MNRKLVFALMTGTHRCVFNDDSGICARCHRMHSPHDFCESVCTACGKICADHEWDSATGQCVVCSTDCAHTAFEPGQNSSRHFCLICGKTFLHSYTGGTCLPCGYQCPHATGWRAGPDGHFCNQCNMLAAHELHLTGLGNACRRCAICGQSVKHECRGATQHACGPCAVCGQSSSAHQFASGICSFCGYECAHPSHSNYVCDLCYSTVIKSDAAYYVTNSNYAGSYVFKGTVNGQKYYQQYTNRGGNWSLGSYYLVVLSVTTPTTFGGDYAYIVSGAVFTTNIDSFPINPSLVEGNGKYNITLKQYTTGGDLAGSKTYTSADCKNLTGLLPK